MNSSESSQLRTHPAQANSGCVQEPDQVRTGDTDSCFNALSQQVSPDHVRSESSCPSAIVSLVLGALGLAVFPPLGLLAVLLGMHARKRLRTRCVSRAMHTAASIGLMLGIIASTVCILGLLALMIEVIK